MLLQSLALSAGWWPVQVFRPESAPQELDLPLHCGEPGRYQGGWDAEHKASVWCSCSGLWRCRSAVLF